MSRWLVALWLLLNASVVVANPKADEADVRVLISGHFAVDHIGPTEHAAILKRMAARPRGYLAALERIALAATIDGLSSLHIPAAIGRLAPHARPEATALAKKLLPVYKRALAAPPGGDPYRSVRLRQHLAHLASLAK
jgi:hypothetical protein